MLRRIGTLFSLLAVFVMIDGNWAVLQTVAWARMIESDLATGSCQSDLPKRVAETFAGQRVCPMCAAIIEQRSGENDDEREIDPRFSGIQIGPVNYWPISVFPPSSRRTPFLAIAEIYASVILPEIEPPPRSGHFFS